MNRMIRALEEIDRKRSELKIQSEIPDIASEAIKKQIPTCLTSKNDGAVTKYFCPFCGVMKYQKNNRDKTKAPRIHPVCECGQKLRFDER